MYLRIYVFTYLRIYVFMCLIICPVLQPVRPLPTASSTCVLPAQINIARNVFSTGVERKKLIDEAQVAGTPTEFARVSTRSYLLITANPAYYV